MRGIQDMRDEHGGSKRRTRGIQKATRGFGSVSHTQGGVFVRSGNSGAQVLKSGFQIGVGRVPRGKIGFKG